MECTCLELHVAMIWKEHLWHSGQNSRYILKIHTEVHFSLSIWKVPASNVKRWSEEEKAISLKGMSWCAAKPVVDPSHCSAAAAQISTSIRTFPKYRWSHPKRTTVIILTQSVSLLIIKVWESLSWTCRSNPWPSECLPRMKCTPQQCRTQSWSYHGTFSVPRRGSNLGQLGWQPSTLTTRLSTTS